MRYASAPAFRVALEGRLRGQGIATGESLSRLRKLVAFDRLLARLLLDPESGWVLKGGLSLDYRFRTRARTTKDVDLTGPDSEATAISALVAVQSIDLGDYFRFAVTRTERLQGMEQGRAVRFSVRSTLAGRTFEDFVVDVGFGGPPNWEPDLIEGRDLLAFAGLAPVIAPTLPLELQVPEKLHAYTAKYGDGVGSSRVKDLVDMALIAASSELDGDRLQLGLSETFGRRGTHERPDRIPRPPSDWATPYRRMALEIGLPPNLGDGYLAAQQLLDPSLANETANQSWDPNARRWLPR